MESIFHPKTYENMTALFEAANDDFLRKNASLFQTHVSERTLCGALMLSIHDLIVRDASFNGYYADVEYNRNKGSLKTICKTILEPGEHIIKINCDLVLHSRGEHVEQDNLIAIEMKKSTQKQSEKDKDRSRLVALTKDSFNDLWSYDGRALPEHVCRYLLGVYYEIDYKREQLLIEYYRQGYRCAKYTQSIYR